ncbi:tryptophan 2,3-dioxygenase [Thermobifida halotolerans]|uniref:Tryptophan 2,3-dioxygenase n=1 Tax=Thermobifida halotolerans TaxID=483545 RepID=A0A399G537_9ACTN|nr:tryptophan 2,3-dioxygenase family protein [Thermobifida halotolerans]UOE21127.1 tryptophan 2,3-dioxygenase [Thermobifida halotolerans]
MVVKQPAVSVYSSYLALDELLSVQRPNTDEHDEMLFVVVHQTHELWFKQLLHEFAGLQRSLAAGDAARALRLLHRSVAILRVAIFQIGVLETMGPSQFSGFRDHLGGSGFQSAQFRELEAVLGARNRQAFQRYPEDSEERRRIEAAMTRPPLFDSLLGYLAAQGYPVPEERLRRDVSLPAEPSARVQDALVLVYRDDGVPAQICERLLELDQSVQEWRYRHVNMVQRIIGDKTGTGGSTGAAYLRTTLFTPAFPDLWAVRNAL